MGDYNATCPFCGEEALRGFVTARYGGVPLFPDGYDPQEGMSGDSEVEQVSCHACNRAVPVEHYVEHGEAGGEACACKEAV